MMRIESRLLIRQQETLLVQLFGKVFFFSFFGSHFKLGAFKSLMSLLETLENVS